MSYYEDEILRELTINEKYTEKQLAIFVVENIDVIVISKSSRQFIDYSKKEHQVIDIIEGYIHKGENRDTYHIPNGTKRIYVVD